MPTFYEKVWKKCMDIPKGKVTTYKELGKVLNTKAYRAIGTALRKNPCAPAVPCHRVINSNGKVGNYSGKGGRDAKIELLRNEGIIINNGSANLKVFFYKFKK